MSSLRTSAPQPATAALRAYRYRLTARGIAHGRDAVDVNRRSAPGRLRGSRLRCEKRAAAALSPGA
jgi:hypothetical protein